MNAWQKTYQGWTQGCNMVRVRSSGTFTLLPLELPCDGAQVLQIPMPKTRMFMRSGGGGNAHQRGAHALLPRAAHEARHRHDA